MSHHKIILCSNIIWTITQFRSGLIKALVKEGFEVVCVADTDDFSELSEMKVKESGASFVRLTMNRKGKNPFQDISYFIRYYRILKQVNPGLVINYTIKPVIYGSIAAWLSRIPSFAVTTGLGFVFTKNNLLTRFTRLLYKFSLQFTEKVFFLNPDDKEAFISHGLVSDSRSILLPGEGIDSSFYSPVNKIRSEGSFIFLLIARLLWEKGIAEYVAASEKIQQNTDFKVRFLLAGYLDKDNPGAISQKQLQQWTDEGVIEYRGTTEDIRPLISEADCVVLPSYREGVPRTLLEGASMQKPLIASDCPGCREVVDDGINGYLCEPRNSTDLYYKMVQMLKLSPDERCKMGLEGRRKIVSQFEEKMVTDIFLREIEKITE